MSFFQAGSLGLAAFPSSLHWAGIEMKGYQALEFSNISLEFLLGTGLILQSL